MCKRARCRAIHCFGERRGPALGNNDGVCSGCMCGSDNRTQIVRVLYTIQQDEQIPSFHVAQLNVLMGGPKSNHALMRDAFARAVQRVASLEPDGHGCGTAQFDNLLNTRSSRALCD
jgi:hypothetical protein